MPDFFVTLFISVGVGFGALAAMILLEHRNTFRPPRAKCQNCHHRYWPDESMACVPEAYCGESCEVADLERVASL